MSDQEDTLDKICERAAQLLGKKHTIVKAVPQAPQLRAKVAPLTHQRPRNKQEALKRIEAYVQGQAAKLGQLRPEGCPVFHRCYTSTETPAPHRAIHFTFHLHVEPLYMDLLDWVEADAVSYLEKHAPIANADRGRVKHLFKVTVKKAPSLGTIGLTRVDTWGRPKQ